MTGLARGLKQLFAPPAPTPGERVGALARLLGSFAFLHLDRARLGEALRMVLVDARETVTVRAAVQDNQPAGLWLADGVLVVVNTDATAFQARLRLRQLSRYPGVRGIVAVSEAGWVDEFAGQVLVEDAVPVAIVRATLWTRD
jgi:hypothetical protein